MLSVLGLAAVASSKNRRRNFARGKRVISLPSQQATEDMELIQAQARISVGSNMPFDEHDAVQLDYDHDVDGDVLHVRVTKIGTLPPPGQKRGTKRDLHGMMETLADALQGVLYPNDNQIDAVIIKRLRNGSRKI